MLPCVPCPAGLLDCATAVPLIVSSARAQLGTENPFPGRVLRRFKQYLVKMMNTYYFEYQTYRDAGKGSQKKSRKPKRKVSELSSEAGEDSADEDEQPDTDEDEDDEEAIAIARWGGSLDA